MMLTLAPKKYHVEFPQRLSEDPEGKVLTINYQLSRTRGEHWIASSLAIPPPVPYNVWWYDRLPFHLCSSWSWLGQWCTRSMDYGMTVPCTWPTHYTHQCRNHTSKPFQNKAIAHGVIQRDIRSDGGRKWKLPNHPLRWRVLEGTFFCSVNDLHSFIICMDVRCRCSAH